MSRKYHPGLSCVTLLYSFTIYYMTWDQNVNVQQTCKDRGDSDHSMKIFYHYLHKTALIKQE